MDRGTPELGDDANMKGRGTPDLEDGANMKGRGTPELPKTEIKRKRAYEDAIEKMK